VVPPGRLMVPTAVDEQVEMQLALHRRYIAIKLRDVARHSCRGFRARRVAAAVSALEDTAVLVPDIFDDLPSTLLQTGTRPVSCLSRASLPSRLREVRTEETSVLSLSATQPGPGPG
jgi:hypothetical protein